MISYNHERFISKAIESVLAQKFCDDIQIVIGVDKSEDKTKFICKTYHDRFPESIELIIHDRNVGMFENFVSVLKQCTGKYIAILEGDDFWTDENKLHDQFLFFEKHPNCILSSGGVIEVDDQNNFLSGPLPGMDEIVTREDLIVINRLSTLTVAFRRDSIQWDQLALLSASPHLDWGLYLSLNFPANSFAYKFGKVYGAYRKHSGGVYSLVNNDKRNQNILKTIIALSKLRIEEVYKAYLKSLYSNFTLKLEDREVLKNEPYSKYYDERLIIYSSNGGVKWWYIRSLYKKAFFFMIGNIDSKVFKLHWELFRQTRLHKKNYLNIFIILILPLVSLMRSRDNRVKKKLLKAQL